MTPDEATRVLATLRDMFPGQPLTERAAQGWYESALRDTTLDEAGQIVATIARTFTGPGLPTPAEFNGHRRDLRRRDLAEHARRALGAGSEPYGTYRDRGMARIAEIRAQHFGRTSGS